MPELLYPESGRCVRHLWVLQVSPRPGGGQVIGSGVPRPHHRGHVDRGDCGKPRLVLDQPNGPRLKTGAFFMV